MADLSAEQLALLAYDLKLIDERQFELLRTDLGRLAGTSEDFRRSAARHELLTNYQIDRMLKRERTGYFYGDYKVLYLAGKGSFARVYRANHTKSGKVFAVKVLRKQFRDDVPQTELFLREGEVGLLLRHPNIVPVYEVSTDPAAPYFVMDFVEGQNLRDFVKVRRKLPVADCTRLMIDVMAGLTYAAQQGIFHRDLKLSNVLVTSRGTGRLVDFGLYGTRASNESAAETPNARTIDYVALERSSGARKNDPRSDIFFAGCMLYQMLTGIAPLPEAKERSQRLSISRFHNIRPLMDVAPELPRGLSLIVMRAMELAADRRYQTPADMLLELQTFVKRQASEAAGGGPGADPAQASLGGAGLGGAGQGGAGQGSGVGATAGGGAGMPAGAAVGAAAAQAPLGEQEGANHTVMIVESNSDLQNVLRDKLKKHGYRVLVISDPMRAVERFKEDPMPAECAMFCAGFIGEPAVEAFNLLAEDEKARKVPAVLLLDEHQMNLAPLANLAAHRVLLRMPLKVKDVRDTLKALLGRHP
jgi:serine/threonine-protein kinase